MPEAVASNPKISALLAHHKDHLLAEGFTDEHLALFEDIGVRSITEAEAVKLGFKAKASDGSIRSSSGLLFPFDGSFAQIRCDRPIERENGKVAKYLTPIGQVAKVWNPPKNWCTLPIRAKVVTEGFKDAAAGSLFGDIPTGALAGISHACKAIPRNGRQTFLGDFDTWTNPNLIRSISTAASHSFGKIQIVPKVDGEPKAGLCEWFKALRQAGKDPKVEYEKLIDSAMSIEAFVFACVDRWRDVDPEKLTQWLDALFFVAARHFSDLNKEHLIDVISQAVKGFGKKALRAALAKKANGIEARKRKERQKNAPKLQGIIPIETTFDEKGEPFVKMPQPSTVANVLAEHYRSKLAFSTEDQEWYRYESELPGVWSREPDAFIEAMIATEIDASGGADHYSFGYIASSRSLLKAKLAVRRWDEATDLLPLQNGVLNLATNKLEPHSPGYRFTWQLPYAYNPAATCQPIIDWLHFTQDGDGQRVQLLRAYLKAIVTGRSDLQRFLEAIGPGGSGKSTFGNLAVSLVGMRNVLPTSLEQLQNNRFETANLKRKRLLYITDSDRYGGAVSVLKTITGGDILRNEEKNKQQRDGFIARLMVLMVANEPIQSTDYTSGLERRRITVPFLKPVPAHQQKDLLSITSAGASGEFVPHLPGLLNWVLALPDDEMKQLIKQTVLNVPALAKWKAESLVNGNPIAEWLDARCVLDPDAVTRIGDAKKQRFSESEGGSGSSWDVYINASTWLYANYCDYCDRVGANKLKIQRFSPLLLDLLNNQLKVPAVKTRTRDGAFVSGIAIRSESHDGYPTPVTNFVMDCDEPVTAETRTGDKREGCDDYFQTQSDVENNFSCSPQIEGGEKKIILSSHQIQKGRHNRHSYHRQGFQPSHHPSRIHHHPSHCPKRHTQSIL
ncbi:MAG: hypothetical protein HC769_31505 [Cyanobacteria bacterium CRU_2_1]|nr:hypothetical protein [Cyanobacteria bacterium CRU_2_1]